MRHIVSIFAAAACMAGTFTIQAPAAAAVRHTTYTDQATVQQKKRIEIAITMTDQGFQPTRVVAVVNEPVFIRVVNRGSRVHQLSIPHYYIFTRNLGPGEVSTIEFTPSDSGTFPMVSDPSGTDNPEFSGSFVVTDMK